MRARRPLPGGNVRPLAESGQLTCSAKRSEVGEIVHAFGGSLLQTAALGFPNLAPLRPRLGCHSVPARLGWTSMESVRNPWCAAQRDCGGETTFLPESIFLPPACKPSSCAMPSANAPSRYSSAAAESGADLENWAQAESEIMLPMEKKQRRTAVVIDVNGVPSVRKHGPNGRDGDLPAELSIRFDGEKCW
jgi:hypothetical protein